MPTYQRPGVYVEETLSPLSSALASPGLATAAFVGENAQGPSVPTLVSSWSQYKTLYGGFSGNSNFLPYSVYSYFQNGGNQAWVVRAAPGDSVVANVQLNNRAGSPAALLKLTAASAGDWANTLTVDVADTGPTGQGRFNLVLTLNGLTVERWLDVTMNPTDGRYLVAMMNSPVSGSQMVSAINLLSSADGYAWSALDTPAVQTATPLTGGQQGSSAADLVTAAELLESVDGIINLNLPGVSDSSVINPLITWAEGLGTVFLVVDTPSASAGESSATLTTDFTALTSGGSALSPTSYAAVYGPWLNVSDPGSSVSGAVISIPAGGAVLGVFARTDSNSGVAQSPAGTIAGLSGVISLQANFTDAQAATLNNASINLIRKFTGHGFLVWGARTLKTGYPDRYVAVRRTLQYIRKALVDGLQFTVFRPNDQELWTLVTNTIQQFLLGLMQQRTLAGGTPADSFFVVCDATNNPPSTVGVGELHVEVGVALQNPAEFVIITLGQIQGSSTTVTETL